MKIKKLTAFLLAGSMTICTLLAGCSGANKSAVSSTGESKDSAEEASEGAAVSDSELLTIEVFADQANYQGKQIGWFAKVIKDKFNIELNIIAPNVSGDGTALYQTRATSGYLGDIIIIKNDKYKEAIQNNLVLDMTEDIKQSTYLKDFEHVIDTFNSGVEGLDGKYYGFPNTMNNVKSLENTSNEPASTPLLPWDLYQEIGAPEIKDLSALLDVLQEIQDAHPTNEAGDPAYAFGLWADWDDTSMANVRELTPWYGQQVKESLLVGGDGSLTELTDDNGAYYKILNFLYEANKRGLVDPDSGAQDWDTACAKMGNKQTYLFWYQWQRGFWNTDEKAETGDFFVPVPISDMRMIQESDVIYGDGYVWAMGSNLEGEKKERVFEFLDWMASPEASVMIWSGLADWNYSVDENGLFSDTEKGIGTAIAENLEVPQEYGGGSFKDGMCQINSYVVSGDAINPDSGEAYTKWSSHDVRLKTKTNTEWMERFDSKNMMTYLTENNMMDLVPAVNIILPEDTTDISVIRSQCGEAIVDTSWKMALAKSDEEFEQMWSKLKTDLTGLGWDELVEFDKEKYQKVVDQRVQTTKEFAE